MQAEREKNLNISIGLHGVRLACMQAHEVARPDSDSAVVKQEIHKVTHAEQRDFARGGMARHASSGGQRQPYHFETFCLQKGGGPDWPGRQPGASRSVSAVASRQGPSVARCRVNRPSPRTQHSLVVTDVHRAFDPLLDAVRLVAGNASRSRRRYGRSTDPTRRQRPPSGWKISTLDRGARNSRLLRRAGGAIGNRSFRSSPFLPKGARSSTRRTRSRACIARYAKRFAAAVSSKERSDSQSIWVALRNITAKWKSAPIPMARCM